MSEYPTDPGFVAGSDTSEMAAESMQDSVTDLRAKVCNEIARCGWLGATCDELEVALDMKHQTCSARCTELKRDQLIFASGIRRKTRGGRCADVYVTEDFIPMALSA